MKPIWKSKTFWVNGITGIIQAAELARITDYLTTDQQLYFAVAVFALNVPLRWMTSKPVTLK